MTDSKLPEKVAISWPPKKWRDFTVLVGVSGGADSVCLLRAVHQLKSITNGSGQLVIGHINHGLRGAASDADAEFVRQFGDRLEIPVEIETGKLSLTSQSNLGSGLEARLRRKRYELFERMAARHGARNLLTGHTRDDQIETVLFRILRGTGIEGLAGIPFSRQINESLTVVRPLLNISRDEVLGYLESLGQDYREDASNASDQFTRNRIRNTILPQLRDCFDNSVDDSIIRLTDHARNQTQLIERLTDPILAEHFAIQSSQIEVSTNELGEYEFELVKACLRRAWRLAGFPAADMTAKKWERITLLLTDSPASVTGRLTTLPGSIEVSRIDDHVTFHRLDR